jgi:hypothetical protein
MPAIAVLLDHELLATVNTSGYDVVSVCVHGTRIDDGFATLEMSGGAYPDSGESTHLIWINSKELRPGQRVEVHFRETGETFPAGKTIRELFPEEQDGEEPVEFVPTEAVFAELRTRPLLRAGFSFELQGSAGNSFAGRTAPEDHGFGFNLLWNSHRAQRAGYSLHAYTLDDLEQRTDVEDYVREYVEAPYALTLRVDA